MFLHSGRFILALARIVLIVSLIGFLSSHLARASTLDAQLVVTPANTPNTGLYNVAIQVQSIGTTDGTAGDGGIEGLQFDIVSLGTNLAQPVEQILSGSRPSRVKTAFNLSPSDFLFQDMPLRIEAGPAFNLLPPEFAPFYVADGDPDAVWGFFGPSQLNTTLGRSGMTTIATEQWQLIGNGLTSGETLKLLIIGPAYYDFQHGPKPGHTLYYTTANVGAQTGFLAPVPEPDAFCLAILGLFGLIGFNLHDGGGRKTVSKSVTTPRATQ